MTQSVIEYKGISYIHYDGDAWTPDRFHTRIFITKKEYEQLPEILTKQYIIKEILEKCFEYTGYSLIKDIPEKINKNIYFRNICENDFKDIDNARKIEERG